VEVVNVLNVKEIGLDYDNTYGSDISGREIWFSNSQWSTRERNYTGTRWDSFSNVSPQGLEKIRECLAPITERIGLSLSDEEVIRYNPKKMLEDYCKFRAETAIQEISISLEKEKRYNLIKRKVRIYEHEDKDIVFFLNLSADSSENIPLI